MSYRPLLLTLLTLLLPAPLTAQVIHETSEVLPSEVVFEIHYGGLVVASDEFLFVGSPFYDDACPGDPYCNSGALFAFRWDDDGSTWEELHKITASDASEGDRFGGANGVAADAETLVVGAMDRNGWTGAAYVFHWNDVDETWDEVQILEPTQEVFRPRFGTPAVHDDVIVVGSRGYGTVGNDYAGSAYVYRFDEVEEQWLEEQILEASSGEGGDHFGTSVAVEDQLIAVGASEDDDGCPNTPQQGPNCGTGSVYVFRYEEESGDWLEEQQLVLEDSQPHDGIGTDLAIDQGLVIVGTQGTHTILTFAFDEGSAEWELVDTIEPHDPQSDDLHFPGDLDVDQGVLVAPELARPTFDYVNQAYVYFWNDVSKKWDHGTTLVPDNGTRDDLFGSACAISGTRVIVGATHATRDDSEGDSTNEAGTAYHFDLTDRSFLRGDVNDDGDVEALNDAITLLAWGFTGGTQPPCLEAADIDGDGRLIPLLDTVALLLWGFANGEDPAEPGPTNCGLSPDENDVPCLRDADVCD